MFAEFLKIKLHIKHLSNNQSGRGNNVIKDDAYYNFSHLTIKWIISNQATKISNEIDGRFVHTSCLLSTHV